MSRQKYIEQNGKWVPANEAAYVASVGPTVMGDIAPFNCPDGAHISGRSAWREHLKRTDTIELNHSDMTAMRETWNKRQSAHRERLKGSAEAVMDASKPGEIHPFQRSNLNVEIANRLHNRPTPERKELIKLTLDLAKRNARGNR